MSLKKASILVVIVLLIVSCNEPPPVIEDYVTLIPIPVEANLRGTKWKCEIELYQVIDDIILIGYVSTVSFSKDGKLFNFLHEMVYDTKTDYYNDKYQVLNCVKRNDIDIFGTCWQIDFVLYYGEFVEFTEEIYGTCLFFVNDNELINCTEENIPDDITSLMTFIKQ